LGQSLLSFPLARSLGDLDDGCGSLTGMAALGPEPKAPSTLEVLHDSSDHRASHTSGGGGGPLLTQVGLMFLVVATGCANNISKQIASKPLNRYSYMMGLSNAISYVPLYGIILLLLLQTSVVPRYQISFVWQCGGRVPIAAYFAVAALGDALGDGIGMICTPYVSGPVHSLLSNCTPVFIALLSLCVLSKRLSLMQCLALLGVFLAVAVGVLPSFEENSKSSDPFFSIVLGASCIFNAISFVVKELLFVRYGNWLVTQGIRDEAGLNVFVVNTHAALFQLPFTLLSVPLNVALGQTHGEGLSAYVREAFACVFGGDSDSCGSESSHGEVAGLCVAVYVVFNILWNISILVSVKHSGALATFVALKAMFPVSTVLFAVIDWPLLGRTQLHWLVWISVCLLLPCIGAYQWSSRQQAHRAEQHPSLATCCWPLFGAHGRLLRSE